MNGMSTSGIILRGGRDEAIERIAKKLGLPVILDDYLRVPFEKTLIVQAGTRVPWDLLDAAWGFLDRWDAAVPVWQYTVTAESVGTAEERERTRAVVRDLRVLLHAVELLFVAGTEGGRELVKTWQAEAEGSSEIRLAFLRALYAVKPRVCVLPVSWLKASTPPSVSPRTNGKTRSDGLVRVEIMPGQFVKCREGEDARVLEMLRAKRRGV